MSALAETVSASLPAAAPRRRKPMRMTPAKLRAQRANARLSTGPRTVAGRRRSSQNRRKLRLSAIALGNLEWHEADLAEVRRLWQEVMAVFWFIDSDCRFYLQQAAYNWWLKLDALRKGDRNKEYMRYVDDDIEKYLRLAVDRFAKRRQRSDRWLRKELGVDVREEGIRAVREVMEGRLGTFHRAMAPTVGSTTGTTAEPGIGIWTGPGAP